MNETEISIDKLTKKFEDVTACMHGSENMKQLFPLPFENYHRSYGSVDYRHKIVLDVGADWGTTASFFLGRGARKVIAVEGDRNRYLALLKNIDGDSRVIAIHEFVDSSRAATSLLQTYFPHVVKIDIEGSELHFLLIPNTTFQLPEAYVVETHTNFLTRQFLQKFKENDYRVSIKSTWLLPTPHKLLTARRLRLLLPIHTLFLFYFFCHRETL